MVTAEMYQEARDFITAQWNRDGVRVIELCAALENPFHGTMNLFMDHCVSCGGDWTNMLLSGIKELWPEVYAAIPVSMGKQAFFAVCYTLLLCGVDTTSAE